MELIKVYEHKKIKIGNEVKHILKICDVKYAEIKATKAIIPNYEIKELNYLDNKTIENEDYVYQFVNIVELKSSYSGEDEEKLLEKAKHLLVGKFYEFVDQDGIAVDLKEVDDERIKEEYNRFLIPSKNAKLDFLFRNGISEKINLNADLAKQLLGKVENKDNQASNDFSSIVKKYHINEYYEELKNIVFGHDKELKIFLANIIRNLSLSDSSLDIETVKRLKSNILLIGPTGTGKTLMVESIANILDKPYIIVDAKRYTSNAYVGEDIENILLDLYHACGNDLEKTEHGIIFIDEFDKLCDVKDGKNHVVTTDVQESILKMLDGSKFIKRVKQGLGLTEIPITFDTSRITFVLSGAYSKLSEKEKEITREMLKEYGMIPELAGRIKTTITLDKPNKKDLKDALLNGKYSYLKLFNEYLEMLGVEYNVNDEFINYIVDKAFEMNIGYRGLEVAISEFVDNYLFDLLSGDIKKLEYKIEN